MSYKTKPLNTATSPQSWLQISKNRYTCSTTRKINNILSFIITNSISANLHNTHDTTQHDMKLHVEQP